MAKLTPEFIKMQKSTDKHRRFSDGDGLSLVVRPNGSKAWQVRIVKDGRKTDQGIGGYPDVGLAAARREAKVRRDAAASARVSALEPASVEGSNVSTFAKVAEMYLNANAPTWKHPKTETNMRGQLTRHAYPAFGQRPIGDIRRSDVMAVLETVWTSKPAVGRKLKQALHRVFVYALARDWDSGHAGRRSSSTSPTQDTGHARAFPLAALPRRTGCLETGRCLYRRALREAVFSMADTHGVTVGVKLATLDGRTWTYRAGHGRFPAT